MSQLVFRIQQNPNEVGSNASKSESKQIKRASLLLPWPPYSLPVEGVAQVKGESPHLKRSGIKVGLPTLNNVVKKKIPHKYTQSLGFSELQM